MKRIINNPIFTFIIGSVLFGSIGSIYAYRLLAEQVEYNPEENSWNVSNVDNALDNLYDISTYGDASENDILSGKTALVNGQPITGTLTIPNYTDLTGNETINPGESTTSITGFYNISNFYTTCTTCQPMVYVDPDAVFNITINTSSRTLTATKTYTLGGREITETCTLSNSATLTFGGLNLTRTTRGGAVQYTYTVTNKSDSRMLYNDTYYEPGAQILSQNNNAGGLTATISMSKLY